MSKQIFVIGASGKLGGSLYSAARKLDLNVHGTSTDGSGPLIRFNLVEWSDFDFHLIEPGDMIYFTAAISSPDICSTQHDRAYATNVTYTTRFIKSAILRGANIVFFSSDTVYGESPEPFDERAVANPAGEYAQMKHTVEAAFLGNELFKSIRLSYVFFHKDTLSHYLKSCAEQGQEADLYDPFERSVICRNDVISAALSLRHHWDDVASPVLNFGGPEVLSRKQFADILRETTLPTLRYRITAPGNDFFASRPRRIAMKSPWLSRLLGRDAVSIREAAAAPQINDSIR